MEGKKKGYFSSLRLPSSFAAAASVLLLTGAVTASEGVNIVFDEMERKLRIRIIYTAVPKRTEASKKATVLPTAVKAATEAVFLTVRKASADKMPPAAMKIQPEEQVLKMVKSPTGAVLPSRRKASMETVLPAVAKASMGAALPARVIASMTATLPAVVKATMEAVLPVVVKVPLATIFLGTEKVRAEEMEIPAA